MNNILQPFKKLQSEDRFAIYVSAGIHAALILFFIFYTFTLQNKVRPSFIQVEFGEYQSGTQAEHAKVEHKKVAESPHPSKTQPKKPKPEPPKPKEQEQVTKKNTTKPVDAPDQKKEVKSKKVKTPKTDKVNPEKNPEKKNNKNVVVPPKARQADKQQKGAKKSGDKQGTHGKVNADQGSGNEKKKSAPYNLKIEGLHRDPVVQPLPKNSSGYNATVVVRFEVTPDGNVTRIIPLRKSGNPAIDREVIRTLNHWQFSPLPTNAPQQNQKGVITFRFVNK